MDIQAALRITAQVGGQQSIDRLSSSVGALSAGFGKIPVLARAAGGALVGLAGGFSAVVLAGKFDDVVQGILKIKDASEKTGTSIEKLGQLAQVAKVTGDDFSLIEGGIIKMNKALAGSDDASKGAARALDAIGLSVKDLRSLDPADAFSKIATQLDKFEDGGAKGAVAMDIFGRSGAQLLPFMKDYVELGDEVTRVTTEQANEADAYDRSAKRLTIAVDELFKVFATAMLPVATDFIGALLDINRETGGVQASAQRLKNDGSLTGVFREAARGALAFMDIIDLILRGLKQVQESFGVVLLDIKTYGNAIANAPMAIFSEQTRNDIAASLAERDRLVNEANRRMAERWGGSMTPYTDAFEARVAQREMVGSMPADPGQPAPPKKRTLAGYVSRTPTAGKAETDPFVDALSALGGDAAKLQFQLDYLKEYGVAADSASAAQMRFETTQGKFAKMSEKQRTLLVMQAEKVDELKNAYEDAKFAVEFDKQSEAINRNTAQLGMNAVQRDLSAAAQELENQGIKRGTDLYDQLMAKRRAALEGAQSAKRNPVLGIQEGLVSIGENVNDVAGQMKNALVGAFDGASDALTQFVMTGKLKFGDLARSILADLAKMIVKQMLFNLLSAGMNAMGLGSLLGPTKAAKGMAVDGGVRKFASGGVVTSPTMFKFASGGQFRNGLMGEAGPEAIMPLARTSSGKLGVVSTGGGGSTSVVVNVNVESGSEQVSSNQGAGALGKIIAGAVRTELINQKRPGGLLAA